MTNLLEFEILFIQNLGSDKQAYKIMYWNFIQVNTTQIVIEIIIICSHLNSLVI